MQRFLTVTGILFLVACSPLLAQDLGVPEGGTAVTPFEAGLFANGGVGSIGLSLIPGVSAQWGDFPVKLQLGYNQGAWEGAVSADWLAVKGQVPSTPFQWFVGPGIYGAEGTDFQGYGAFGFGVRGVCGVRTLVAHSWDVALSLVPSYGTAYDGGSWEPQWNLAVELGLQYVFPAGK